MMFVFAVAFVGMGSAAADQGAATQGGGGFTCLNKASITGVECIGSISVLPISVDVKNVGVLDGNKLTVLSNDLNHLAILDGGVLNHDKILNDTEVTVLQDFLDKFDIDVTRNDIDVCTVLLGAQFCK
jgi:hypothetical protein